MTVVVKDLPGTLEKIHEQFGFMTAKDRGSILQHLPDFQGKVLIRCSKGERVVCTLRDLPRECDRLIRDGESIRDVSVPKENAEWVAIGYVPL